MGKGSKKSKVDAKRKVVIYQDSPEKEKKPRARPLTAEEKIIKQKTAGK